MPEYALSTKHNERENFALNQICVHTIKSSLTPDIIPNVAANILTIFDMNRFSKYYTKRRQHSQAIAAINGNSNNSHQNTTLSRLPSVLSLDQGNVGPADI